MRSPGTEVDGERRMTFVKIPPRRNVGICQIRHMNVVAFAGTVPGRVICTEDAQRWLAPPRSIDGERYEAGLRIMPLDEVPVRVGATRIEITKYGDSHAICGCRVFEDFLAV